MTAEELVAWIVQEAKEARWVIATGGEPCLQLDDALVEAIHGASFKIANETNWSRVVCSGVDWVTVSPKVAEHVLSKAFTETDEEGYHVDELRYVRHAGQDVPHPALTARRYFLSPHFDGNRINAENVAHCVALCMENPLWTLSLQLHKLIHVL
jgi:organic radical activating enzyme